MDYPLQILLDDEEKKLTVGKNQEEKILIQ